MTAEPIPVQVKLDASPERPAWVVPAEDDPEADFREVEAPAWANEVRVVHGQWGHVKWVVVSPDVERRLAAWPPESLAVYLGWVGLNRDEASLVGGLGVPVLVRPRELLTLLDDLDHDEQLRLLMGSR